MTRTPVACAISSTFLGLVVFGALALMSPRISHGGGKPCKRTVFKTSLVKQACVSGGQSEAKKTMKKWVRSAKKKKAGLECATCHSSLAPDYPLTKQGLALFKELGGK